VAHLPASDHFYLYLLVEDGSLYPVHGLSASLEPDANWMQNVGPLLDAAMIKVNQLKPQEIRAFLPARFNTTTQSLGEMCAKMAALPAHIGRFPVRGPHSANAALAGFSAIFCYCNPARDLGVQWHSIIALRYPAARQ
jgi:hypothetical protein